jgi:hypothetical protein
VRIIIFPRQTNTLQKGAIALREHITIAGVRIHVNDKLVANKNAQENGICKCGDIVEVRSFLIGERTIIGLYSPHRIKGWSDLDGAVPPGRGLWQDSRFLLNVFDLMDQKRIVATDFNFKKRNLRGMKCRVVHCDYNRKQSFVEFEEDVGGGCADGLGKMGHCVVLPSELLENVQEGNSKVKKKNIDDTIKESPSDLFGSMDSVMKVNYIKYNNGMSILEPPNYSFGTNDFTIEFENSEPMPNIEVNFNKNEY